MNEYDKKEALAAIMVRQMALELAISYCAPCDLRAGVAALLSKAMEESDDAATKNLMDSLEYPSRKIYEAGEKSIVD